MLNDKCFIKLIEIKGFIMLFKEVSYKHLPCQLVNGQYFIGQISDEHSLKSISNYIDEYWPLKLNEKYFNKDTNIHKRINNGHYIKAKVRYYKERVKLINSTELAFNSAYSNLAVFDDKGRVIPIGDQKYIN
mgnify:FL=1